MKFLIIILLGLFLNPEIITLEDLKWKNRVLLYFIAEPEATEQPFEITPELQRELEDRDLVCFIIGKEVTSNANFTFEKEYAEKIRKMYSLGSKTDCYVLIGKDGGSKLRTEGKIPDWQELFATIDAMPMRVREMRENEP